MAFHVALPSPSIDFSIDDGIRQIPIEQRSADEVETITAVLQLPPESMPI